ncbi:MAG: hypothetical protein BK997_03820 [Candidatus Micrarchaeum sp. ARMAN-1]|jgi:beta-lactamase regulating signal transducer with metallopeptidase domain|nr:MAG: hypothetical protein BK997_03820 [Candidatus Micrarchaeum sp. ARMAN-1]
MSLDLTTIAEIVTIVGVVGAAIVTYIKLYFDSKLKTLTTRVIALEAFVETTLNNKKLKKAYKQLRDGLDNR